MKVLCVGGECDGQWVDVERERLEQGYEIKVVKVDMKEDRFVPESAYDAATRMKWDFYKPTRYQASNVNGLLFILRHYPMDELLMMQQMMERYSRCAG